eukprot:GHVH01001083.1.p1 GENE.GHVH01001083.1~~GHVH01001083.1.p1  ORF type:complete len:1156 (+),score=129.28 GHVH01001083.1:80-3547(+)
MPLSKRFIGNDRLPTQVEDVEADDAETSHLRTLSSKVDHSSNNWNYRLHSLSSNALSNPIEPKQRRSLGFRSLRSFAASDEGSTSMFGGDVSEATIRSRGLANPVGRNSILSSAPSSRSMQMSSAASYDDPKETNRSSRSANPNSYRQLNIGRLKTTGRKIRQRSDVVDRDHAGLVIAVNVNREILSVMDVDSRVRQINKEERQDGDWVEYIPKPRLFFRSFDDVQLDKFPTVREIAIEMATHLAYSMMYRQSFSKKTSVDSVIGRKRPFDIHPSLLWTSLTFMRYPAVQPPPPPSAETAESAQDTSDADELPLVLHHHGLILIRPRLNITSENQEEMKTNLDNIIHNGIIDKPKSHEKEAVRKSVRKVWGVNLSCASIQGSEIWSSILQSLACFDHLRILNLASCGIDDQAAVPISEAIQKFTRLTTLILTDNQITSVGLGIILTEFLPSNRRGAVTWSESSRSKYIHKLINDCSAAMRRLEGNDSARQYEKDKGRQDGKLMDMVNSKRVILTLKISENAIGIKGGMKIAECLDYLPKSCKLVLEACNCGMADHTISDVLCRGWSNLVSVDFRGNSEDDFAEDFESYFNMDSFPINYYLTVLRPGFILSLSDCFQKEKMKKDRRVKKSTVDLGNVYKNLSTMVVGKNGKKSARKSSGTSYGYEDGKLDHIFPVLLLTPNLKHLDLSGIDLGVCGLNYLSTFLLGHLHNEEDDHHKRLVLPFLTILSLANCNISTLTDIFVDVVTSHPFLRCLDLSDNTSLTAFPTHDSPIHPNWQDEVNSNHTPPTEPRSRRRSRHSIIKHRSVWSRLLLFKENSPTFLTTLRLDGCSNLRGEDLLEITRALVIQRQWVLERWAMARYKTSRFSVRSSAYEKYYHQVPEQHFIPPPPEIDIFTRFSMFEALVTQRITEKDPDFALRLTPKENRMFNLDRDLCEYALNIPREGWKGVSKPSTTGSLATPLKGEPPLMVNRWPAEQLFGSLRWYRENNDNRIMWNELQQSFKAETVCDGLLLTQAQGQERHDQAQLLRVNTLSGSLANITSSLQLPYHEHYADDKKDRAMTLKKLPDFQVTALQRPTGLGLQSLHVSGVTLTEKHLVAMMTYIRNPTGWYKGLPADDKGIDDKSVYKLFLKMPPPTLIFSNLDWSSEARLKGAFHV